MSEAAGEKRRTGDRLAELGKRRGFFFPSFESYGGVAGLYTYGPNGAALKRHLEDAWRDRFTVKEGNFEIHAPTVTPKPVLDASGHTDAFDDMLIECGECGETHRADHLVEDATELEDAESVPPEEMAGLIEDHDIRCPECGASLVDRPVESFNLMFETAIGPGDSTPGFLRPETAQSIFVEFPRLAEYARSELPFGVTQIGPGYRNEISPRRGLVRVREFGMAELELFVDPARNEPPLSSVAAVQLRLYPIDAQAADGKSYRNVTVEEALERNIIQNQWVAYYVGLARQWYDRIGIDPDRLRFRQHQAGERAHYATDCWDAEVEIDGAWIEIAGLAHRGCYDLAKHDEHADDDYTVFRPYDEPVTVERATVAPDMGQLGPTFGEQAPAVVDALEELVSTEPEAFEGESVAVTVDDTELEIPVEHTGFSRETVRETGERIMPEVIEPSFGIDRTVYTILAHNLKQDVVDGEERTYLALPSELAPTFVAVFPLMDRDGLGERARSVAADLRAAGFEVAYDDSGNIGRRYRRQDEVGTPFCVTIDYDTLEDGTVTIRDRDTTAQERVAIDALPGTLRALGNGDRTLQG